MNFFAFLEGSTYVVSIGIKNFSSFSFPLALFGTWKQVVFGLYWPYFPEFSKICKFFFVILKYPQGVTKHHIKPGRGTPGGWEIAVGNFTTIGPGQNSIVEFLGNARKIFRNFSSHEFDMPRGVYGASLVQICDFRCIDFFKSLAIPSVKPVKAIYSIYKRNRPIAG